MPADDNIVGTLAALVASGALTEGDLDTYHAVIGTDRAMRVQALLTDAEFYDDIVDHLEAHGDHDLAQMVEETKRERVPATVKND